MIPSVIARQIQRGVEDFLLTTFPITNPFFAGTLEKLLATPGMLFRGPYEGPGKDLYGIEWATPIVLAGSLILLGIWPRLLIDRIEPQIEQWLRLMGITS